MYFVDLNNNAADILFFLISSGYLVKSPKLTNELISTSKIVKMTYL